MKRRRVDASDTIAAIGAGLVLGALWWVYWPAAAVFAGLCLMVGGLIDARRG